MARETGRHPLVLSEAHRQMLVELSRSQSVPRREVEQARILLKYTDGVSISDIQRQLGPSRSTIYKCNDKAPGGRPSRLEGCLPPSGGAA